MKKIPKDKSNYMVMVSKNNILNYMVIDLNGKKVCLWRCDPAPGFFQVNKIPEEYNEETHHIIDIV